MRFKVDNSAVFRMTEKLQDLKKSALPAAINSTLNNAAFDVKQNTMLTSARKNFIERSPNFLRANSIVIKSTGFNINRMIATVGFKSLGGNNYAVDDLEEQEYGGAIDKKSFIPTVFARKNKNTKGLVKTNLRLKTIRNIINSKDSAAKNKKEAFVIAASIAGKSGFVLRDNILFKIETAPKSNLKTRKANFKAVPVYSFKKGRKSTVNSTHFMENAVIETAKKMNDFYIKNGEYQLAKYWK